MPCRHRLEGAGVLRARLEKGAAAGRACQVEISEERGMVWTDDTREQYARSLQASLCLVERGVAAETRQLVSELRAQATRAKDGMIARVARPYVEKRRFRGSTCGFMHAEDDA